MLDFRGIPDYHNAVRKWVKFALAVVVVAVSALLGWEIFRFREPVYQGRPLSFWLKDDPPWREPVEGHPKIADEAVRHLGTNAIPTLLRMLRAKDSALKVELLHLAQRQHFIKITDTPADQLNYTAAKAFEVLGAEAQSAVPALVEIANQKISQDSQLNAIDAMGSIGPAAKEAVPSLLCWATNADVGVRWRAICALSDIHADPKRVVPVLANALRDPDPLIQFGAACALPYFGPGAKIAVPALVDFIDNPHTRAYDRQCAANAIRLIDPKTAVEKVVPSMLRWARDEDPEQRQCAISALGYIHADPDRVVPALTTALRDADPEVRGAAARALGEFGPDAKPAISALVKLLNAPDADVTEGATNALKAIDPEAAAKAGVR